MARITKRLLTVALLISALFSGQVGVSAQEATTLDTGRSVSARSVERRFAIYYWLDRVDIDEHYLDNEWQIAQIRKYLLISPKIDSITISSYASPEGVYERNVWLARKRAEAARRFIVKNIPEGSSLNGDKIVLRPQNENWDGLRAEIEANYKLQNKDRVLRILDSNVGNDTKKWRIQHLDNGYTWHYIIVNHMPKLRLATWICVWVDPEVPVLEAVRPDVPLKSGSSMALIPQTYVPTEFTPSEAGKPAYEHQMILAGRTNLLVPGLNFGIEIPIGRHISIGADYWYPWWLAKNNKYCGEMLGWFIDGKYWFTGRNGKYEWTRADKLKGHALGIYAGCGYYDYQKKMSGYQGEYIDFGVDYTFGLPIGRRDHKWMRMEFNIGVGCMMTQARHYTPTHDYTQLIKDPGIKQKYYTFFGPTRAGISFVLPIIVKHKVKGGER